MTVASRAPAPWHTGATPFVVALLAAFAARLLVVLLVDPFAWVEGSDSPFYVRESWKLAHGQVPGLPVVAPVYVALLSLAWLALPGAPMPVESASIPHEFLTLVRLGQVVASIAAVGALGWLARRVAGGWSAGALVVVGLGLGPAFVLEPFRVLTESTAMAWMGLALTAWLLPSRTAARAAVSGVLFGLAAMTRPVMFGLPFVLAACDAWSARRAGEAPRVGHVAALIVACLLSVLPWMVSLRATTGSWAPQGFQANLWIGAVGDGRWIGTAETDALRQGFARGPDDYVGEVTRIVAGRPLEWLGRRLRNLGAAMLQPHFASDMGGESVRAVARAWLAGEAGWGDLARALVGGAGPSKLLLYVWHWIAVFAGLAGLVAGRGMPRGTTVALAAVIAYFLGVHLLLTALPRYLLPIQVPLWLGVALWAGPARRRGAVD